MPISFTFRKGKRGTSKTTRFKIGKTTVTKTQRPGKKQRTTVRTRSGNVTRSRTY